MVNESNVRTRLTPYLAFAFLHLWSSVWRFSGFLGPGFDGFTKYIVSVCSFLFFPPFLTKRLKKASKILMPRMGEDALRRCLACALEEPRDRQFDIDHSCSAPALGLRWHTLWAS